MKDAEEEGKLLASMAKAGKFEDFTSTRFGIQQKISARDAQELSRHAQAAELDHANAVLENHRVAAEAKKRIAAAKQAKGDKK